MRIEAIGLGLAASVCLATGAARAQVLSAPDLERSFICPEALDRAQNPASPSPTFLESLSRAAPGASPTAVRLYWRQLLVQHACATSLGQIRAREEAIHNGVVEPQAWLLAGGDAAVSVAVSEDFLEPFIDPRAPDAAALETYVRAAFAAPRRTDLTSVAYDEVVSHVIYYCDSGQRALLENVYLLNGRTVRSEPHAAAGAVSGVDVYTSSAVPPGSLNAVGLTWACAGLRSAPR